jgi:TonB family protein
MRSHATVLLALWVILCVRGFTQNTTAIPDAAAPLLKVCSKENPSPCADTPPYPIHAPEPQYTREAQDMRIEGTLVLAAVVGDDGKVKRVTVTKGLGGGLEEKAIKTVMKWKLKPAKMNGRPVTVEIKVECEFHLYHQSTLHSQRSTVLYAQSSLPSTAPFHTAVE